MWTIWKTVKIWISTEFMMKFNIKKWKSAPVTFSFDLSSFTGVPYMMKDVRKALGTFWRLHFLQGVIFEYFHENHGFPAVWVFLTCSVHFFMQETVVNTQEHNRSELHIIFLLTYVFRGSPSQMYLWVWSVAVNGRVLRTPLGHDLCSCHEQSRFWHGRGIIKFPPAGVQNLDICGPADPRVLSLALEIFQFAIPAQRPTGEQYCFRSEPENTDSRNSTWHSGAIVEMILNFLSRTKL